MARAAIHNMGIGVARDTGSEPRRDTAKTGRKRGAWQIRTRRHGIARQSPERFIGISWNMSAMQKAQPYERLLGVRKELARRESVQRDPVADKKFLKAWKKVADRKVRLIFGEIKIDGPFIPDGRKEEAVEEIYRHTLWEVCWGMTEEESAGFWGANRDAMDAYASELADKAAVVQWGRISAASK